MADNKKILIIEDEELILKALSEGFKRRGFEISKATDGKKGLESIENEKPDLILLDLLLPIMNGQEVLEKMKEKGLLKKIPVIILTNMSDGATLKKCIKMGAREYIIKVNFSFEDMERIIKEVL
ncbi:response regulator [Candidatus Parcubacteria bacterium]|nr:response regulator [Candidatus Parcubacteria bacterium]